MASNRELNFCEIHLINLLWHDGPHDILPTELRWHEHVVGFVCRARGCVKYLEIRQDEQESSCGFEVISSMYIW